VYDACCSPSACGRENSGLSKCRRRKFESRPWAFFKPKQVGQSTQQNETANNSFVIPEKHLTNREHSNSEIQTLDHDDELDRNDCENLKQKFKTTWCKIWPWLYEKNGKMFCKMCVEGGKQNSFA
jgi:hypothetical protein